MDGAPLALSCVQDGDGPPVVLVHGFTQTGASWAPLAAALAERYRVVRVDAPGHGGSADIRTDLWSGARLLGSVGGSAAYFGYSMGARLCLHLALSDPTRVRALALLGATAGIDDPHERVARRRSDEMLAVGLEHDGLDAFLDRWLAQPLFAGLPHDPTDLQSRRRNTVAGLASSLRLTGTGTQDPPLWDRLPELAMPVLVIAGAHDTKFRALAERLASTIGANASMAVVAGAGHAAHLEAPAAFLDLVIAFLSAHSTPQEP